MNYTCNKCFPAKHFSAESSLKRHQREKHATQPTSTFNCNKCAYKTSRQHDLKSHTARAHPTEATKTDKRKTKRKRHAPPVAQDDILKAIMHALKKPYKIPKKTIIDSDEEDDHITTQPTPSTTPQKSPTAVSQSPLSHNSTPLQDDTAYKQTPAYISFDTSLFTTEMSPQPSTSTDLRNNFQPIQEQRSSIMNTPTITMEEDTEPLINKNSETNHTQTSSPPQTTKNTKDSSTSPIISAPVTKNVCTSPEPTTIPRDSTTSPLPTSTPEERDNLNDSTETVNFQTQQNPTIVNSQQTSHTQGHQYEADSSSSSSSSSDSESDNEEAPRVIYIYKTKVTCPIQ